MDNLHRNGNGGWYVHGKERPTCQKKGYEDVYFRLVASSGGSKPAVRAFATEAKISLGYAQKLMKEIEGRGEIVPVEVLKEKRSNCRKKGVGVCAMNDVDICVLLQ